MCDHRLTTVRSFSIDYETDHKLFYHRLFHEDDHIECQDENGEVIVCFLVNGDVVTHDHHTKHGTFTNVDGIWVFDDGKDIIAFSNDLLDSHVEFSKNLILLQMQVVSAVPHGWYCHGAIHSDENGRLHSYVCPFWDIDESKPDQNNGFCKLLNVGDWTDDRFSLLWDQVKECGINVDCVEESPADD